LVYRISYNLVAKNAHEIYMILFGSYWPPISLKKSLVFNLRILPCVHSQRKRYLFNSSLSSTAQIIQILASWGINYAESAKAILNVIMLISYFTPVLNSYTKESSEESDFSSLLHAFYRGLFSGGKEIILISIKLTHTINS